MKLSFVGFVTIQFIQWNAYNGQSLANFERFGEQDVVEKKPIHPNRHARSIPTSACASEKVSKCYFKRFVFIAGKCIERFVKCENHQNYSGLG